MYLNCHSWYSLRYGTIPVEELVEMAHKMGVETLALTDINVSNGIFDFILECKHFHIKPIVGVEFRNTHQCLYIGLARNEEGLRELNELVSRRNIHKTTFPERAPMWEHVYVIYPFETAPLHLRDNEFVGISYYQLNRLYHSPFSKMMHKIVIQHPVTIRNQREYQLHKVLRAIDQNIILSKLETKDYCSEREFMHSQERLLSKFKDHPQLVQNTLRIIDDCNFDFDFNSHKNKANYTDNKYHDRLLLEQLVNERFEERYDKNNQEARNRVQKELDIIDQLGFSAYFLCTWDIINYSLSKGFFHVGRGSGANSIIAYILKITNVCPLELDLYFERFLNPARKTPPDFDIDWSWDVRDQILDYIFGRFDPKYTAFCGTINTFKYRSCHREVGKVMGLPKSEIDQLSRNPQELHDDNSIVRSIHQLVDMLHGFPNQRSMHACGVFISERPITYYTALDMYPKGYPTTQFDMYTAEDIGFEKFDILSQRGLGSIQSTIELVKKNHGVNIDFNQVDLYKDHPIANKMLAKGQTLGCFYVESPAMRGLLKRLKANNYKVLVAASSVIRPGVAKSGMLREYQRRHNFPNDFEYIHPVFEQHLGETYGVMVYQEDVIKIAHHFAGLDMADADILRRGMSGKSRSKRELEKVKEKFFVNCQQLGHPPELVQEVYRQIESFAGYSFCKSHSASYAVESYLAIYLKARFPLEFMVAVINNFGGFYRSEVYFHEARMSGGILHKPCVNHSEYLTQLKEKDIYIGFIHMKGFDKKLADRISMERKVHGDYRSLEDFIERIAIGIEHLQQLIFIGAFSFTGVSKNELVLTARMVHASYEKRHDIQVSHLFHEPIRQYTFPKLESTAHEQCFDELEILEFPVSKTPFDLLKTNYRGNTLAQELANKEGKIIRIVGYAVCRKRVPTVKGEMSFFTFWDTEGYLFDTTNFPDVLKKWPWKGAGCYLIEGKVVLEFAHPTIEVHKMDRLPMISDPRYEFTPKDGNNSLTNSSETMPGPLPRKPYPSKETVKQLFLNTTKHK
ncbi:DNA polymerase III subunit alpha [Xanthovirga aplysinae]|uniref:DNA polymerase III subunit alpha n=1 Tax=Xanthovirga aplysinae TaxID=2529853 RepID=UPI0012BD1DFE|nr:DNA polymerase III subunit alpha [Xanthovirga aplysinae]MTI30654.1 DNA polymerase III subunit alpha [Xanthovirga aplysinae]